MIKNNSFTILSVFLWLSPSIQSLGLKAEEKKEVLARAQQNKAYLLLMQMNLR